MRRGAPVAVGVGLFMVMCAFGATLRGASQAAQEPASPPILDGAKSFEERGCAHCHKLQGKGGIKGPNLSGVGKRLSAGAIRKQIIEGGGAMPPYADVLSSAEVDALTEMLHQSKR